MTMTWDRWRWPLAILTCALALRLILFTGIQGNDDRIYSATAFQISRGQRPPAPDLFRTRWAYVAPVAALYAAFGVHFSLLIAPSMVASLGLVALVYRLGHLMYSAPVARGAAVFASLLPLDVFYATSACTDLPLALLIGLGAWLLCDIPETDTGHRRTAQAILAGLAWGAAHLTKESGLLLVLPVAALVWVRGRRNSLIIACLIVVAILLLELLSYGIVEGDPFYRIRLAVSVQTGSGGSSQGFLAHLLLFPSFCLYPLGASFPYSGGLLALSAGGCVWALLRDRRRSAPIVFWWLGGGLLLTLFPISLFPYRPALNVQARMFAVVILPGALLASAFLVEGLGSRRPWWAVVVAGGAALLSLACAVRLHQDGLRCRIGVEWAHRWLAEYSGAPVVTDPRTAETLRMMSSYAPTSIRGYAPSEAEPPVGTLLLDVPRLAAASRDWDGITPPAWWTSSLPERQILAEHRIPGPWRLRGPRGPEEVTVIRRVIR